MFGWFKKKEQEINSTTSEEHIEEMEKVLQEYDERISEIKWGLCQDTMLLPRCSANAACPKCESEAYVKDYVPMQTGINITTDGRGYLHVTLDRPIYEHVLCRCNCGYEWQTRPADFDERYKKENGE